MNPTQNKILMLTSFPPRECGIATYSQDLIKALHKGMSDTFQVTVCALENGSDKRNYPEQVNNILNTSNIDDYLQMAEKVNNDENIKMVFIQHEFGLFGGDYGEYLLYFIYSLHKPIVVTFHTVLPKPDEKRKVIIKSIIEVVDKVVVMTQSASDILLNDYSTSSEKIVIIPHGTHPIVYKDKHLLKKHYNAENKMVLSTFGLLSSNKNIETAIEGLPAIVERFPETLYLIIGITHPEVVKYDDEIYRESLKERIHELELGPYVRFINRYPDLPELLDLLQMTDIYLFTSKDRNQAVSGTFAYAMSCGCPIVATAIPHAKELLDSDTGILTDFENPKSLSDAVLKLLNDNELREHMSTNIKSKSVTSHWNNVAIKHAKIIQPHLIRKELIFNLPEISLKHLNNITGELGIIQFCKINTPDLSSGYTLDDNSRGLIAVCMNYDLYRNEKDLPLIEKYLRFIEFCQQENYLFFNYIDQNGSTHSQNEQVNLEDANGRAIWALGKLVSLNTKLPESLVNRTEIAIRMSFEVIEKLSSPRALAFCIKGLYYYNTRYESDYVKDYIRSLTNKITQYYNNSNDIDWKWYENYLTYGNSVLPESMLYAYLSLKDNQYKSLAKETFDFLLSKTFIDGQISVISNNGWWHKDQKEKRSSGGEQPIEVAYTIETLKLFYDVFEEPQYYSKMETAFSWFLGNNKLNQMVYNGQTGGCHDGLEINNVNLNQGAESTICYLMARLAIEEVRKDKAEVKKHFAKMEQEHVLVYSSRSNARHTRLRIFKKNLKNTE